MRQSKKSILRNIKFQEKSIKQYQQGIDRMVWEHKELGITFESEILQNYRTIILSLEDRILTLKWTLGK